MRSNYSRMHQGAQYQQVNPAEDEEPHVHFSSLFIITSIYIYIVTILMTSSVIYNSTNVYKWYTMGDIETTSIWPISTITGY